MRSCHRLQLGIKGQWRRAETIRDGFSSINLQSTGWDNDIHGRLEMLMVHGLEPCQIMCMLIALGGFVGKM